MAVTFEGSDVKDYVGAPADDDAYCSDVAAEAKQLVNDLLGTGADGATLDFHNCIKAVPDVVLKRGYMELAAELYNRRDTKNGVSQFADLGGASIRIARDPMVAARPIFAGYLMPGLA